MSTKTIRILVTTMIELQTELPVEDAINEFQSDCDYTFKDTANVKVIDSEWRETKKVSYTEYSKDGKSFNLKPLK
jgi:hypothetical protein